MSALQSPMRVHGDNIYVRHSNLMLEVGTGVAWWLQIRTTCFCVLWRHQNYNFLCTDLYRTAALSHSQALRACLRVFICVDVCISSQHSIPAVYIFSLSNYSLIENVVIWNGSSANCPDSHNSHFELFSTETWRECCHKWYKAALLSNVLPLMNQMPVEFKRNRS